MIHRNCLVVTYFEERYLAELFSKVFSLTSMVSFTSLYMQVKHENFITWWPSVFTHILRPPKKKNRSSDYLYITLDLCICRCFFSISSVEIPVHCPRQMLSNIISLLPEYINTDKTLPPLEQSLAPKWWRQTLHLKWSVTKKEVSTFY